MTKRKVARRKKPADLKVRLPKEVSGKFVKELLRSLPNDDGFKTSYLREEILSKYCDPKTTPAHQRKSAAIEKWLGAEARNERTNMRLYLNDANFGWATSEEFFLEVRRLISRILGPMVPEQVLTHLPHTNGASTRIQRYPNSAVIKLVGEGHITPSALSYWLTFASSTRMIDQGLEFVEQSKLFTVPKKTDIDRVACKEPEVNGLLQRSVGLHIRRCLRRYGIDLNDQSKNQHLASVAVKRGLATIDLSMASDTISRQLVFNSLPFEWYSLLDDLRVKSTSIPGRSDAHTLEMFSSMGNGFTFELESLLFYAITRVVCRNSRVKGAISVYGDDIIAPCDVVPRLARVLHYCGFTMNPKKTHATGLFRESCGKHYYGSSDVTPFYIRREISTLNDLINILNRVLEWDGRNWGFFITPELMAFHLRWSKFVPRRLYGGIHADDPTALVTGHSPRHRIIPKTRKVGFPEEFGITHWLLTKEVVDEVVEVTPVMEVGFSTQPIESSGERTSWYPYLFQEEM